MVLDRRKGLIHQMNATAGFIWERCDGTASVEDIVASVATEFGQSQDAVRGDVEAIVSKLVELDLVLDVGRQQQPTMKG